MICLSVFDANLSTAELQSIAHALLYSKKLSTDADKATVKESQILKLMLKSFITRDSQILQGV